MTTRRYTSQIQIQDWTTVQMWMTAGNQFTDAAPLDDVSGVGTGPFLAFERGIWKYPQQNVGGRIRIPESTAKPVRLIGLLADFGANTAYTVSIAGIDGTPARPDNTSGIIYPAVDAALYREGTVQINTGTTRYLSVNFNTPGNATFAILQPGMDLIITTTAGAAPRIRATFGLCYDHY